jgi:hypothetical protein
MRAMSRRSAGWSPCGLAASPLPARAARADAQVDAAHTGAAVLHSEHIVPSKIEPEASDPLVTRARRFRG